MRKRAIRTWIVSSIAFSMLSLGAQGQVQSAREQQCAFASAQCKTDIGPGISKDNDEHCGRMMLFCQNTGPLPLHYSAWELRLIDRAIRLSAAKHRMSLEAFRDNYAPVLVELPNMICVGMVSFMSTGGETTTICFDKSGEKIVLEYTPQ